MNPVFRRPSFFAGIASFVLAVISFLAGLWPGVSPQVTAVIGLVFLITGCFAVTFVQQHESEREIKDRIDRLEAIINLEKEVADDDWLRSVVGKLVAIRRADKNKFSKAHVESEISQRLDRRVADLQRTVLLYERRDEMQRMLKLLETIDRAERYYYAFTFIAGTYLPDFFDGEYYREYLLAHRRAIRRKPPVEIMRVFGVDGAPLSAENRGLLKKLVNEHYDLRIPVRVIRLPSEWNEWQASFAVCDDEVCSVSYSIRDGGRTPGSWGFDPVLIQELKRRFEVLRAFRDISHECLSGSPAAGGGGGGNMSQRDVRRAREKCSACWMRSGPPGIGFSPC